MIVIYKFKNEPLGSRKKVEFVNVYCKNDTVMVRYVEDDRGFELMLRISDLEYLSVQPD